MKFVVSFKYKNVPYQYTIDEKSVDMTHYEGIWDAWVAESENELSHSEKTDIEDQTVFEITADKMFVGESHDDFREIITGGGIYINVYPHNGDRYTSVISTEEIEVKYA